MAYSVMQLVESNYDIAAKAEDTNSSEVAEQHFRVIGEVLKVYESWMDAVKLAALKESGVLQVCSALLQKPRFQSQVIVLVEKVFNPYQARPTIAYWKLPLETITTTSEYSVWVVRLFDVKILTLMMHMLESKLVGWHFNI